MSRRVCLAALSCVVTLACSDPDEPPAGGTSGSGAKSGAAGEGAGGSAGAQSGSGGADTGEAGSAGEGHIGQACNDIDLEAPPVGLTYDDGPAPAATGGDIETGSYFLTAQVVYETASGPTLALGRTQVLLSDDTWQEVSGDPEPGSVNPDRHATSNFSLNDGFVVLGRVCPSTTAPTANEYSVDDTGFTLYVEDAGKVIGNVFTQQ